jgi:hypothetical protein
LLIISKKNSIFGESKPMKLFFYFLLLIFPIFIFSQEVNYSAINIAKELKENSNAVVRLSQFDILISSQRSMTIKEKRVVTILNEYGLSAINAADYYDKNRKIVKIEATVYNAFGKEIKSARRKDFKDNSVGDGFSVFNDNRILTFDYTPINYPFTVVYESEIETSNTVFLPTWTPIEGYFTSTEKAVITVASAAALGFKYKELNFSSNYDLKKEQTENKITFTAFDLNAVKYEELSPAFLKTCPHVMMGLELFHLEGIDGAAKDWKEMGLWFAANILAGTSELPESTIQKIRQLVGDEQDAIEKAKIVYDFVQQKTRYVSIQEGIGGWKPMLAKDVDRLGYGDCKALSNYTKSLLEAVGVPSYYTRLYGDNTIKSVVPEFVSFQSNHVILAIPTESKMYWLECTSQTNPFGFQGTFTDNRNVLVLKPTGGEIIQTQQYTAQDNTQNTLASYQIDETGKITGVITINSKGTQYENKYLNKGKSSTDLDVFYKEYFGDINNLLLRKVNFIDNKNAVEFTEYLEIEAEKYADATSGKLMFVLNAFNNYQRTPKRYRTRENAFEISRGYYDVDKIEISIPVDYIVEAMPNNLQVKNKFGEYQMEIVSKNENSIIYIRTLLIKEGSYENHEYDEYRLFREQIAKNDNAKIVITKKS